MAAGTGYRTLRPQGSWVYLLAAMPVLVFAIVGLEYGAWAFYLLPALLCLVQFFRPTKPVWFVLFVLYLVGTAAYVVALIKDVGQLADGGRPSILLDSDDSVVFVLLVLYLLAMCYGMFRVRPIFRGESVSEP